ncbi:ribonuclease H-like domain-containing protein [Phyllosticta capitalensis]
MDSSSTGSPPRPVAGTSNMPVRTKPAASPQVKQDDQKGSASSTIAAPASPGPSGPQSGSGGRLLRRQSLVLREGTTPTKFLLTSTHVVELNERTTFEKLLGKQLTQDKRSTFPLRQEFGQDQKDDNVRTNHFQIKLPATLFHYTIGLTETCRTRGLSSRKRLVEAFFDSVNYFDAQETDFATDYILRIVSWKELNFPALGAKLEAEARRNIRESSPNDRIVFSKKVQFGSREELVAIYSHGKVDLATLEKYVEGQPGYYDWDNSVACQSLTIILSKAAKHARGNYESFQVGNNKIFIKSRWDPLDIDAAKDHKNVATPRNLVVCHHGFSFIIKPAMGHVLLNLNSATSAFFQPQLVSHFINQYLSRNNRWSDIEHLLDGIRVYVDYKSGQAETKDDDTANRIKTINGFGERLDNEMFQIDGKTTTVYDYLVNKYKVSINKDSRCINLGGKNHAKVWLAPEMLQILPYQQFPSKKLSSVQTANMIKHACKRPVEKAPEILGDGLRSIGVGLSTPNVLDQSSLKIDPRMLVVPSRRAPEPSLAFSGKQVIKVQDGQWKFRAETKFLTTGPSVQGRFHYLSNRGEAELEQLHREFSKILRDLGIKLSLLKPVFTVLRDESYEEIRRGIDAAVKDSAALVVYALETPLTRPYSDFKTMADKEGLQSQCLAKYWDPKTKTHGYLQNTAMKVNLKLGNINNSVKGWNDKNKSGFGTAGGKNISNNVMILGADVTHPEAKSSPGTPSIAAVVGSIDGTFGKFLGSSRWQQRERRPNGKLKGCREIIDVENMKAMVKERLLAYEKQQKCLPQAIIYYRDGVSEAQRLEVKQDEVSAIKSAYQELYAAQYPGKSRNVPLTAVVVNKRHGTRLFPNGTPTVKDNVPPGTVVDSCITSPYHFDFFMTAHAGIQGTSKPAHYFVIQNELRFNATEIQDFTQKLCAIYARATNTVSYAPPAYYADRLCDRGRYHLREFIDGSPRYAHMTDHLVIIEVNKVWNRHKNPWHENLNDTMFWM